MTTTAPQRLCFLPAANGQVRTAMHKPPASSPAVATGTARLRWFLVVLAALGVVLFAVRRWADDGIVPLPGVMPGSTTTRQAFDLLEARSVSVQHDGKTVVIPGEPTRFLIARLDAGAVSLGWSTDGTKEPLATVGVATPKMTVLEGYCDLHKEGLAVIEVWQGFGPGPGASRIEITWSR